MITISDYVSVHDQAKKLGCNVPTGIAILPRNFHYAVNQTELNHESETSTIRKLWKQAGLTETKLESDGETYPQILEQDSSWIAPIIFVGASIWSQNPHALAVALNVISTYLTDWFKGLPNVDKNATLEIVTKCDDGVYRKLKYKGPVQGLDNLAEIAREMSRNNGRVETPSDSA